jgi:hypothetical protein
MNSKWTIGHSVALFGLLVVIVVAGTGILSWISLVAAFHVTLVTMVVLAAVIGHGVMGLWRGILIDENDRISLSRFQLVLWTVLLVSGIFTAAFGNLFRKLPMPSPLPGACSAADPLGIAISPNVWALMGITLTSAGAAVLMNQMNRAKRRHVENAGPEEASWADLFAATERLSEKLPRRVDMTRVQNFYFTVVLVIVYAALLHQLFAPGLFVCAFPDLTSGMLTLLGISHAGYIIPKAFPR